MADPAVAVRLDEALDVHCDLAAELTLDGVVVFDLVTELGDIILGQILCADVGVDAGLCKDIAGALQTDSVDIGQRDLDALGIRNIDTGYTSHCFFTSLWFVWMRRAFSGARLNLSPVSACASDSRR